MGSSTEPVAAEYWSPRVASSIDDADASIRQMDWEEAQMWSNFVLMRPTLLPAQSRIERMEMRPESPVGRPANGVDAGRSSWTISNRSAHRTMIHSANRKLRLKQFLYDWAPPAFDHPSLWLSPAVTPFLVRDDVAWIGTDYRKLRAAAANLHRTTLELSVAEGEFSDTELRSVIEGLEVASPDALARINGTPFAELSYQRRHISDVIAVPIGYWAYKRTPSTLRITPMVAAEIPANYIGRPVAPSPSLEYQLDSCFALGDPDTPREVEYVYQSQDEPNWFVRVLAWPSGGTGALQYPPELDRQPCFSEALKLFGTDVFYAFGTTEYGSHEAVWKTDQLIVMLIVKPKRGSDREWFLTLLNQIVGSSLSQT